MDNIQSWAYGAKVRMGLLLCSINSGSDQQSKRVDQKTYIEKNDNKKNKKTNNEPRNAIQKTNKKLNNVTRIPQKYENLILFIRSCITIFIILFIFNGAAVSNWIFFFCKVRSDLLWRGNVLDAIRYFIVSFSYQRWI